MTRPLPHLANKTAPGGFAIALAAVLACLAKAAPAAPLPADLETLRAWALDAVLSERAEFSETWGIDIDTGAQSLEDGRIVWTLPDGATLIADPQALIFAPPDGPAEWAWSVEGFPDRYLEAGRALRTLGEERGIAQLTEPTIDVTSEEAILLANIATLTGGVEGILILPSPTPDAVVVVAIGAPRRADAP